MAKFKIATANKGNFNEGNQVNVSVAQRGDNGELDIEYYVEVTAWHKHESDDTECFQIQEIDFPNLEMCEGFVDDFSDQSATKFFNSFKC